MHDLEDVLVLIPLVAIVMTFSVPLAWFYFHSRNKRARYQAVEKLAQTVQDPTTIERILKDEREYGDRRRSPYHRGFVTAAIGAGLLVAAPDHHDGPPRWIGTVVLFIGIALILSDLLNYGFRGRRGGNGSGNGNGHGRGDGPDRPGNSV